MEFKLSVQTCNRPSIRAASPTQTAGSTWWSVAKVHPEGGIEKIKHALVDLPNGSKIALNELAEVPSIGSPHTINRESVQRKVVVSANVSGRDLRGAVNEIQQRVRENIGIPEGYRVVYEGQFESEQKASSLLLITSIIAVLLISYQIVPITIGSDSPYRNGTAICFYSVLNITLMSANWY